MTFSFNPDTFIALRSRNFRIYMAGQCVSLIGLWMQKMALAWLVYRITDSAFKLGVVELLSQAPIIIVGLFAGAWLDRHDIRITLISTQALSLLHAAIMAVLVLTNTVNFTLIFFMSLYFGLVNSVGMPARQASIMLMVQDRRQLKSALGINSMVFNLSRLVGPSIAGFVIYYAGEAACFIINAIAYVAVIYALWIIRLKERTFTAKKQSPLASTIEGLKYIKDYHPLRVLVLSFAVYSMFSYAYAVLFPIFAKDILDGSSKLLGFLMAGIGFGAIFGSLAVASVIKMRNLPMSICISMLIQIVSLTAFAFSNNATLSILLTIPAGASMAAMFTSTNTLMQTVAAEDKRSRVVSIYTICNVGFGPIGAFIAGSMAEHTGAEMSLVICCGIMLIGAAGLCYNLRKINKEFEPVLGTMD